MTRVGQQNQWTAEQTLSYINGLIAAEQNEDQTTIMAALSIAYEYLINATKRKITWSLSLQKLAYEFIDLAFETNMHASVKDIFKSYRSITQGQYSQSLKCVLEHYRDNKLENILDDDISKDDLQLIRALPNIENEEPSTEIIMQSMHPEIVKKQMEIRNKLRIVWEGYKSIVETVRVNQKLEDVYMTTLTRIFDFVDRYNRVQQFKTFCRSLRTGLQSAFNKRDRTYQEKTIYIDIEKTDVNTRNIQIRMEQFKVATKLGLWGEAFTVLEDINTLMRVRKAPLKNSLRCQYFENLALLFSKNNFWHYHAYAYYNFYLAYLTKPRLSQEQKQNQADKLLLSILVIPTLTAESQQSRDIQEKLSSMMISSTKVPDRKHLEQLMVSKGVLENASANIRQLWNFMFLEFSVGSLKKGLEMITNIGDKNNSFKQSLQACLINKQLISIAQIYQRIRITSLERLIPLPLPEIKKMLILAHRQRAIDFTFDESQGIIVFQDQSQQVNPSEQFHSVFMSVAIACERGRNVEEQHIMNKAEDFIQNAEHYIWEVRGYKIDEFKRKIKKQLPELRKKYYQLKKDADQQKERLLNEQKVLEAEKLREKEEAHRVLAAKKIVIKDIMDIKEQRIVRILDKKIENLTDEEIENIDLETFKQHLELTKLRITNNKDAKLKKAFTHVDYLERERRDLLAKKVEEAILSPEQQKQIHQKQLDTAKKNHHQHNEHKARLQNLAKFYKNRVESELKKVYSQFDKDMEDYHQRLEQNFKQKILTKAKNLHQENQRKKQQQLKLKDEQRWAIESEQRNGAWGFAKKRVEPTSVAPTLGKKTQPQAPITKKPAASNNIFEKLQGVDNKEETKRPEGKWGIGTKRTTEPEKKPQQGKKESPTIQRPERPREDNTQKWSFGTKKAQDVKPSIPEPVNTQKRAVFAPPPPTSTGVEKKGKWGDVGEKKQEKKPEPKKEQRKVEVKKGKGW